MKLKLIPSALAILTLVFGGVYMYTRPSSNQITGVKYTDNKTGFSFSIPNVWKETGYSVEKSIDERSGATIFRFVLKSKDARGTSSDFMDGSVIAAVPATRVVSFCLPSPISCALTKEIGHNSTYVFLSVGVSPEGWASCVVGTPGFDQAFFDRNKALCQSGQVYFYPDDIKPGVVTVFEPKN